MDDLTERREYSARYGLNIATNDLDTAQQLAENKYRSLVRRELSSVEINEINELIHEVHSWKIGSQGGFSTQATIRARPSC